MTSRTEVLGSKDIFLVLGPDSDKYGTASKTIEILQKSGRKFTVAGNSEDGCSRADLRSAIKSHFKNGADIPNVMILSKQPNCHYSGEGFEYEYSNFALTDTFTMESADLMEKIKESSSTPEGSTTAVSLDCQPTVRTLVLCDFGEALRSGKTNSGPKAYWREKVGMYRHLLRGEKAAADSECGRLREEDITSWWNELNKTNGRNNKVEVIGTIVEEYRMNRNLAVIAVRSISGEDLPEGATLLRIPNSFTEQYEGTLHKRF